MSKTLYFTSFRYLNLFYSIPFTFLLIFVFVKFCFYAEENLQMARPIPSAAGILVLLLFTVVAVKLFFMLNTRKISLQIDELGFIVNGKAGQKRYWSQVKSYTFPKDKYESLSNSSSSTVMLSFGVMKLCIINFSGWMLLSRSRRKEEQAAFDEFKKAVEFFCN